MNSPERLLKHLRAIDHYWRGEPEIRLLPELCDPHKIAIDIGANIGTYVYFLRRHAIGVVAYEPNPILAERLARLYPDVKVRPVAVSDKTATLTLHIPGKLHELASVAPDAEGSPITVRAVRLDDEAPIDVGFIKIDVERHELAVLRGAVKTIARCRPLIMTEATPLLYPCPLPETFKFLTDIGYIGWFRFAGKWRPFAEYDPAEHASPAAFGTPRFIGTNIIFRAR